MLSRIIYSYNEDRDLGIWINDKKKRYYYQQMVIAVQKLLQQNQIIFRTEYQKIYYIMMIGWIKKNVENIRTIEQKVYYEKILDKIENMETKVGLSIIDPQIKNNIIQTLFEIMRIEEQFGLQFKQEMIMLEYETLVIEMRIIQKNTNLRFISETQKVHYEKLIQRLMIIEKKCSIIYIFPDDPNNPVDKKDDDKDGKDPSKDKDNDDDGDDDDKNDIIYIVDPEQKDIWKKLRIEILKIEKQLGIVFSIQFERTQYYKFVMMYYYYYIQKKLKQFETHYEAIKEQFEKIEYRCNISKVDQKKRNYYIQMVLKMLIIEEKYGLRFSSYEERIHYEKLKIQVEEIKRTT